MLTWTRVPTAENNVTRYVAPCTDPISDDEEFVIIGRDVTVTDPRGGPVIVREFQAYDSYDAKIGRATSRLGEAKREVDDYLDDLRDEMAPRMITDSDEEEAMQDLLNRDGAAAAVARSTVVTADGRVLGTLGAGYAMVPPRREPVSVDEAMATILHIARRLNLPDDPHQVQPIGDLADLLCKLGDATRAHAASLSSKVLAAQHAERTTRDGSDRAKVIAEASAETARDAESARMAALGRLGDAIVAYDPQH